MTMMTKEWCIAAARDEAGDVLINRVDLEWLNHTAALNDLTTVERRVALLNKILASSMTQENDR